MDFAMRTRAITPIETALPSWFIHSVFVGKVLASNPHASVLVTHHCPKHGDLIIVDARF